MRLKASFWLALGALAVPSIASAQEVILRVYNYPTADLCSFWTEQRNKGDSGSQAMEGWVMGFATSYNLYESEHHGMKFDQEPDRFLAQIDVHCRKNPYDSVTTATILAIRQMESEVSK